MSFNWLELGGIAAAAFGIGLSGAVMPGPVTSVTLAAAGRWGAAAGPLVTLGHGIVEGLLVLALALGAGRFLELPAVTGTISVLGAAVLGDRHRGPPGCGRPEPRLRYPGGPARAGRGPGEPCQAVLVPVVGYGRHRLGRGGAGTGRPRHRELFHRAHHGRLRLADGAL